MPSFGFSYTLKLTEDELQTHVDSFLPLEHAQQYYCLRFSEPDVVLAPGSEELGLGLRMEVFLPIGLKGSGRGFLTGAVRYEREQSAFYLDQPVLKELHIKGVPAKLNAQIAKAAQQTLARLLARYPIYRFNEQDKKQKLAKAMLQSVKVVEQQLWLKLRPSFQ